MLIGPDIINNSVCSVPQEISYSCNASQAGRCVLFIDRNLETAACKQTPDTFKYLEILSDFRTIVNASRTLMI